VGRKGRKMKVSAEHNCSKCKHLICRIQIGQQLSREGMTLTVCNSFEEDKNPGRRAFDRLSERRIKE